VGPYGRLLRRIGGMKWFSWLSVNALVPVDRYLYRATNGRLSLMHVGGESALPTLLLTTTGRKSGQPRTTPVLYLKDAGRLVIVASNFGQERHPQWSENLLADPEADVQVHAERRHVSARLADEAELRSLWPALLEIYPGWEAYRGRTDRSFRAFYLDAA